MIDLFVSYEYRGAGKKWIKADGFVSLILAPGQTAWIPDSGLTRDMIEGVRLYVAKQHEIKSMDVHLKAVMRLEIPGGLGDEHDENTATGKRGIRARKILEGNPRVPGEAPEGEGWGDDDGTP